jgi:hypothetical protein
MRIIFEESPAAVVLPRTTQICCHLVCVQKHLVRGNLCRVPFHLRGIVRALLP